MKHIGVTALFLLSACGAEKADECGNVADGVFVSFAIDDNYKMVRLYEDSTVLTVTVSVNNAAGEGEGEFGRAEFPQLWQKVGRWFNRENDPAYFSSGTYVCKANVISFSSTSAAGRVDYKGRVSKDKLILNSHSQINGHKSYRVGFEKIDVAAVDPALPQPSLQE